MPASRSIFGDRPKPRFWRVAARLYATETMFRSCVDFAVLGLIVMAFVAPGVLDGLGARLGSLWDGTSPSTTAASSSATPAPPGSLQNQGATPVRPGTRAPKPGGQFERQWFDLSPPALRAEINEIADLIEMRERAAAFDRLRPLLSGQHGRDPNVLFLWAIFHIGQGRREDLVKMVSFMRDAAEAGQPEAMYQLAQAIRLGIAAPPDPVGARAWYEKADAAGQADAANQLGTEYERGSAGRTIDPVRAVEYYRKAAERGSDKGAYNLGAAYFNGFGVARDDDKAKFWLDKAVAINADAHQYDLGNLYMRGDWKYRDIPRGIELLNQAAAKGNVRAMHELGRFFIDPTDGRPPDPSRAAAYLRQAAVKGYGPAQYNFAALYETGFGVKQDLVQAYFYYALAAGNGGDGQTKHAQDEAAKRMQEVARQMSPSELAHAQSLVAALGTKKP
jgi:hypothetical protein